MASIVEGLTFDFWNTLIAERKMSDHREERWATALADAGHDIDKSVMERAMTDLWAWFSGEWEGNRVVSPEDAVDRALTLLAIERPAQQLRSTMIDTLHAGWDPEMMTTADGLGDALEGLRSAGLRLGIICDVGLTPSATLRRYLEHHGMLQHFDAWSFSDEVGCYKPDPRIFEHAREALGVAGPMAHIGDLRRTDIAGARDSGWTSLRYTGFFDDQSDLPDADHVVAAHSELAGLLVGR